MTQPTDDLASQMVREMFRDNTVVAPTTANRGRFEAVARRYMEKAVATEREDCARIAEEYPSNEYADIKTVRSIAFAIRAERAGKGGR